MCNCKNAQVGKVRKTRKRRRASVGGLSITKPKDMLNVPTLGAAGVTAYGAAKMAGDATGKDYAILRSKEGAKQLAIGGAAGALLIPGNGLLSKIGRGVAVGLALHGLKVMATDQDWAGNDVTFDKTAEVAGWPYIPGQGSYNANNGNGNARNRVRYA